MINTKMDGLTVVLTVQAYVTPGQVNHVKLAIADDGDRILDSNVFIRFVKAVQPPKVEVAQINNTGDPYYDDAFRPGSQEWIYVTIYMPQGVQLTEIEVWVNGERAFTRPPVREFSWAWQAPPAVCKHEFRVIAKDTEGNSHQGALDLYALVSVKGSVLSYLPTNSVTLPILNMDISPFHEDDLNPESPFSNLQMSAQTDVHLTADQAALLKALAERLMG